MRTVYTVHVNGTARYHGVRREDAQDIAWVALLNFDTVEVQEQPWPMHKSGLTAREIHAARAASAIESEALLAGWNAAAASIEAEHEDILAEQQAEGSR